MPETRILSTSDPQAIPAACAVIRRSGLIAFPTDTIYGVAAHALDPVGIRAIYAAKQRSDNKALPILIGDLSQLNKLVSHLSDPALRIAEAFWPGALTLILPKDPTLPPELSPYPTIGIRMPDLAFTLELLWQTGPLATTSANISDGQNPISAEDVMEQLEGKIDLILDGGETRGSTASTVVDLTSSDLKILREGPIRLADLQSILDRDEQ